MKKLMQVLAAGAFLLLTGTVANAQTTIETTEKTKAKGEMAQDANMPSNAMRDGVMMQGGKILVTQNGKTTMLSEDMNLPNGAVVMKDGTVKMADGSTKMLKDGDRMDMKGHMMHNPRAEQGHEGHDHTKVRVETERDGDVKMKTESEKVKTKPAKKSKNKM